MPITGMDRMPGSGLARGTLFDKELNVTEINVPDVTITATLVLRHDTQRGYTITWTQPSGEDRLLDIPALSTNDTFMCSAATQNLTNKALGAGTTITAGTITGITDLDISDYLMLLGWLYQL